MASVILASVVMIFYYIAVLGVGVWGGRRVRGDQETHLHSPSPQQRSPETKTSDDYLVRLFVASRTVPLAVSTASMTATWFGSGYLNGMTEAVFNRGLLWAQTPLGYALSQVFSGMFFAGKMRVTKSLTMLDPFQQHYGPWVTAPLLVPAVCGEVMWTAAMLSALGDAARVIIHFNPKLVIVGSACVTAVYTSLGSLFSVLYADTFQVASIVVGLLVCLPYILSDEAIGRIGEPYSDWVGKIEEREASQIIDQLLMTILGGVPWQVYFQRVLSADSVFSAKLMSYLSAIGCISLALPPVIIAVASKSGNFSAAGYPGPFNLLDRDRRNVLAYAMRYFTPRIVSFVGLLAITATVMSSVDSSLLSTGTLITRNLYQFVLRPGASDLEMCATLRIVICVAAIVSAGAALRIQSVFDLWMFSSDLVYVLLFPQFVGLFYLRRHCNAYGVVLGFALGLGLRLLFGDPVLGIPVVVKLPPYDVERGEQFPFRTLCMLVSTTGLLIGSSLSAFAFRTGLIPRTLDVCRCFPASPPESSLNKPESTPATSSDVASPSSNPTPASPGPETGEVAAAAEDEHRVDGPTSPMTSPTIVPPIGASESDPPKKKRPKLSKSHAKVASGGPSRILAAYGRRHELDKKARSKKQ